MFFRKEQNTPRIIIFLADLIICCGSFYLAYLLRFNFDIPWKEHARFYPSIPVMLIIRSAVFVYFKTYAGIIRYTSTKDAQRIFITNLVVSAAFFIANGVTYYFRTKFLFPTSIIIIDFISATFLMTTARIAVKILYIKIKNPSGRRKNVIIYGAGEAGVIAKRALDRDAGSNFNVIAFVDDNEKKSGRMMEGILIYNAQKDLEDLLRANDVDSLIIAIQNISLQRKTEIIDFCLEHDVKVLNVPPVNNWINGQLSFGQIRDIDIEDLLERDAIKLDEAAIRNNIDGKKILITGAAGSIGSEIVRQLIRYNPEKIFLLDQAESPLYDLELDLNEINPDCKYETVIADIRNEERMRRVFEAYQPQFVFHAAAYKHVPIMENNPSESILTNIAGTKILADLSVGFNVERFVMISTDKAVNPTNVMGATKRIAEIYIQSLNNTTKTKFITTRFGNVLGSNGSVIPRFKKQIENRQPLTVTHPDITRYFMTIPEACQLVLEASAMGKGGEIYIFDMGKSVKIVDLANKMIKLAGLEPGKDIKITFTGLRPGEKLFEELLNDKENTIPTHHEKIMIAKVQQYDFALIKKEVDDLVLLFKTQDNDELVKKMKSIVPEYVSNNSVFEKLDA